MQVSILKADLHFTMRTWKMEIGGHRKIGRPKLRWSDVIRKRHEEETKIEEHTWRTCMDIKNSMR